MDAGACGAAARGVAESRTRLSDCADPGIKTLEIHDGHEPRRRRRAREKR